MLVSASYLDSLQLCAWLLLILASTCLQLQNASAETLPASELYEKKPCTLNDDCDIFRTFMTCTINERGQPKSCTCEPYKAGENNVTKPPFYSKQAGQCVIHVGEPCTLNPIAGGFGEYKCEPGARCMKHWEIKDPKQYGRCSAAGLVVGWLIPALAMAVAILKPY